MRYLESGRSAISKGWAKVQELERETLSQYAEGGREEKSLPTIRYSSGWGAVRGMVSKVEGSSQLSASVSSIKACNFSEDIAMKKKQRTNVRQEKQRRQGKKGKKRENRYQEKACVVFFRKWRTDRSLEDSDSGGDLMGVWEKAESVFG